MKPNPNSYRSLETEIIRWAEARKIIPNSTASAQARKTVEEAGELLEAAAALKVCDDLAKHIPGLADLPGFIEYRAKWLAKFRDGAGDTLVALINGCALADVDLVGCLADAYDEIKDRRGTMNADGIFVKEQP